VAAYFSRYLDLWMRDDAPGIGSWEWPVSTPIGLF
jgi:hypothetical protein